MLRGRIMGGNKTEDPVADRLLHNLIGRYSGE